MSKIVRIGVFDSGVGGLTVLRACLSRLPRARFYYFGDNRHAPYGSLPPDRIERLVRRALRKFRRRKTDCAVLACNTATAVCAEKLRGEFPFPIVGTEPAVRAAAKVCKTALVLCTPRTAESARLARLIAENPACSFTVRACPRLAGAIERALSAGETLSLSDHLPAGNYDGIVLGCTHYSHFAREISAFYGAPVFDGSEGVARRLSFLLKTGKMDAKWSEISKTNECLPPKWSDSALRRVIFLGKSRKINRKIFKQTFE